MSWVAGTTTTRISSPMNSVVFRKPCEAIPKARRGISKPPMWTPLNAVASAMERLRMNQLLTRVIMANQPPRPAPIVTIANAP